MKLSEVNDLAIYNAECARGILHSVEWVRRMDALQTQFNIESKMAATRREPLAIQDDRFDRMSEKTK